MASLPVNPARLRQIDGGGADTLHGGPLAHRVEQGTFNPKVARSRLARPTRLVTLRTRTRRADEGDVQGDVVGLVRSISRSRMAMCGGMSSTSAAIERENSTVSGSALGRW